MHAKNKIIEQRKYARTSLGKKAQENLKYALKILGSKDCVVVGTASNYLDGTMKEIFGEEYSRDIDISITKKYLEKRKNLEDKLYAEGFVKGAVTEEVNEKRRKVLPDSYVFMKFDEKGNKEIDVLWGFHISSPYFYKPIENREDIKEIAEKRSFEDLKVNVLDLNHQIAEKLMLPEEKRAKSFDKLFQVALILDYKPEDLAEEEALIIKDYARNIQKLNKWWKELKNSGYIFGSPKLKKEKQRFFNKLERKLKL